MSELPRLRTTRAASERVRIPAIPDYHYGYPTYGPVEPNVAAQWLFDEASGNVVDEVAAIAAAPVNTPSYGVTLTGEFAGISPGAHSTWGNPPNGKYWSNAAAQPAMNFGTGNFTIEWWFRINGYARDNMYYLTTMAVASGRGYAVAVSTLTMPHNIVIAIRAEDDTIFSVRSDFYGIDFTNNVPHKTRVVGNRAGNCDMYVDGIKGVPRTSASLAALAGKTINANILFLGSWNDGGGGPTANHFELRVSLNATNNSGGPGGG